MHGFGSSFVGRSLEKILCIVHKFLRHTDVQARSQVFVMEAVGEGQSSQPPEANGGLGAKPPAAGGKGVWGRSPRRSAIFTIFQQK